jgi:hypothetical protein
MSWVSSAFLFARANALFGLSKFVGVLAQARHRDRAHQARPSSAEGTPRAHAPPLQKGSSPASGHEHLAAIGARPRRRAGLQYPKGRTRPLPSVSPPRFISPKRPYQGGCRISNTPSTTATFSSQAACGQSASIERKSISPPPSPDSASASRKSTREFGSSASSTMIWAIST